MRPVCTYRRWLQAQENLTLRFCSVLPVLGDLRPWADPEVLQLRRLAMHVPLSGFERLSLDGEWALEMFESPEAVPAEALTGERPRSVAVAVPGNWTMQDLTSPSGEAFVDRPHYTNVKMPFDGPPSRLPERNPTGVYRRTVSVPAEWTTGRIVLHVGGAESVHAVYVNGRLAGYGTDSRLPSEYDVGDLLAPGANELAIVVIRYSAHSYIEDQDQWWMAGLHRSVWIEHRPTVHIGDIRMAADFDPGSGTGTVAAVAAIDFGGTLEPGWTVRSELRDPSGAPVGRDTDAPAPLPPRPHGGSPDVDTAAGSGQTRANTPSDPDQATADASCDPHQAEVAAHWNLSRAEAWSAETPRLYSLTVSLVAPDGTVIQRETQRVGLRRVEVRDRQLLVNGRPIRIFGVNRHDHHPDRGKAVTPADIRADLQMMRLHNINAVRTSHYPADDAFYEMCDELGFYVFDEANIEGHAYEDSICDDPSYRAAFVDRGARMVQRDRNHPSVIVWSLGNETGYGANHGDLARWIRREDPTRPLHYEPAVNLLGWNDGGESVTDIVCPMYPEIDAIRSYGESGAGRRPLIMCEYSHAMGNSNGSLADYWDAIDQTPGLQGGFIWEWRDQALRQRLDDGTVRLAYGGQFDDSPHDGNFVADGLVSADLEPHPAMREVAWVYRPVAVSLTDGALRVRNRRSFTSLSDLKARWELLIDAEPVQRGELQVGEVAPGSDVSVPLPDFAAVLDDGRRAHLTLRWHTAEPQWFAEAGHVVAWDQIELPPEARTGDAGFEASTGGSPAPESLRSADLVEPRLNLWRAAVDNDGFKLMPEIRDRLVGSAALGRWRAAGLDRGAADDLVDHGVSVTHDDLGTVWRHRVEVPETLADLPRIGVMFELPERFSELRWHGRGPHENYPDRNRGAMIGVWRGQPDELPYLVPQEFGLRTGCRWFEVIDPTADEAVRIEALEPSTLHFSAVHHLPEDLFEAATVGELRRRDGLVVCVDTAHRGLGTASCGPDVLPRYRIAPGVHVFAYRVSLVKLVG